MKEIKVKCIPDTKENNSIDNISGLLDTFERQKLNHVPWTEFPGKPEVDFTIAHDTSNIYLKYF